MNLSSDEENIIHKDETESQSDVKTEDAYDENDYYNDNNIEYKNTKPLPVIDPPKYITDINKRSNENKTFYQTKETFMNFEEKFQKIKNEEPLEDEFPTESAFDICDNYKITFNEQIDYDSNSYDMYSKNHLRITLSGQIKNLDWKNKKNEINEAKKETNAYEDIQEKFFQKKQACQLANMNYLFDKELVKYNSIYEGFPVLLVGDNGGLSDYILYFCIDKGFYNPTIFAIPERNNNIKNYKFRKEIQDKANEHMNILDDFFEENKDIDENSKISVDMLNNIATKISEGTVGNMVDLFIARKVISFNPDYSQELKYKKFLLINTLLAFKCLAHGGNFIIKLYDTFTPFTIGLIYIIFKNFESVSIFKPVSTRQYSSCRFLVAEKYLKETVESSTNSIKYLEEFLTKYIEFRESNLDVKYILPPSELRNNENFLKIIPEMNNGITEKRIDALKEIGNFMNNLPTKLYDKMSIKKFFLEKWGIPVIDFHPELLLKNLELNKRDKGNYQSKKLYTQKELLEMYGGDLTLEKKQEELINLIFSNDENKEKKKKEKKLEKPKNRTLDEKYNYLQNKFFSGKKNVQNKDKKFLSQKKERKFSNNKDNNNTNEKNYKDKSSKKRYEDKKEKKDKKDYKDKNKDDFDQDDIELFKITSDVRKKLNKHEDN